MSNMSEVIQPKSDQINADDLIGGPMTVTITGVSIRAGEDQPISVSMTGTGKVFRPCKSMARVMVSAWGVDANAYTGRSMTLYRDPKVKWGGLEVGGIRISHMSDIEKDMVLMLTQTRASRAPHKVKVLQVSSAPQTPDNALELAEAAAGQGTAAFRAWWNSDEGKSCRGAATENLDRLKTMAALADPPADDQPPM